VGWRVGGKRRKEIGELENGLEKKKKKPNSIHIRRAEKKCELHKKKMGDKKKFKKLKGNPDIASQSSKK